VRRVGVASWWRARHVVGHLPVMRHAAVIVLLAGHAGVGGGDDGQEISAARVCEDLSAILKALLLRRGRSRRGGDVDAAGVLLRDRRVKVDSVLHRAALDWKSVSRARKLVHVVRRMRGRQAVPYSGRPIPWAHQRRSSAGRR
jgi:hypothetical protein